MTVSTAPDWRLSRRWHRVSEMSGSWRQMLNSRSMSHAITSSRPLSYRLTPITRFEGRFQAYRVNGTPADCVALGAHNWEKIDVVLSGINLGTNLGSAVLALGNAGRGETGGLVGISRYRVQHAGHLKREPDFPSLAPWVERTLRMLLELKNLPLAQREYSG